MNIPENTTPRKRTRPAKRYAAFRRRRVEQIKAADWSHATYTDPATGRARTVNIRHS